MYGFCDGAAIRALVDAVPAHVFDTLCADVPELFESLRVSQVHDYINWEPITLDYTPDQVAQVYGYKDYEDMEYSGPFVMLFNDGVLIIE